MISLAAIHQAGVLPYRRRDGKIEVLLITSRGTGRWIFPKGHVEPGLTARESAEFEAYEEAGVAGRMARRSIGSYSYRKRSTPSRQLYRVRLFALEVEREFDDYPEADRRKRRWMALDAALEAVAEPGLRKIMAAFAARAPETIS